MKRNKIRGNADKKFIPAKQMFRKIIQLMRIVGIYLPEERRSWKRISYWGYMIILAIFNLMSLVRQLWVVVHSMNVTCYIVSVGILIYHTGIAYFYMRACYRIMKHFALLMKILDNYRSCFGEFCRVSQIIKLIRFTEVVVCVVTPLMAVSAVYYSFDSSILREIAGIFWPFNHNTPLNSLLGILFFGFESLRSSGLQLVLSVIFFLIWYILITEFGDIDRAIKELILKRSEPNNPKIINVQELAKDLAQKNVNVDSCEEPRISNSQDRTDKYLKKLQDETTDYLTYFHKQSEEELETIRNRFEGLLDILAAANDVLEHFIVSLYFTSLPVIFLLVYGIIKDSANTPMLMIICAISMYNSSSLLWNLLAGAYLSLKIKKPLEYVMKINMKNSSVNLLSTVSLLTARLNSSPIGFTVCDVVTIDTTTMFTIFGTLLTYAIVIFQFAQTADTSAPNYLNATFVQ
ncbi:uncharacterized protein LOC126829250 [Patella vulgata]|uniref:uncharacterized protein LOC126829250 n=1 Tax=Patella vulgata TaxID=6465 RepID=UPI0024A91925|nr:uncharacterized protein LOC126829250 [Patella vulgata]